MWGQFTVCQQSWSSQSWFTWIYSAIQSMDCDSFESLWPACCSFDCPDLTWSECSLNGLGLKIRSRVPFSLKSDTKNTNSSELLGHLLQFQTIQLWKCWITLQFTIHDFLFCEQESCNHFHFKLHKWLVTEESFLRRWHPNSVVLKLSLVTKPQSNKENDEFKANNSTVLPIGGRSGWR